TGLCYEYSFGGIYNFVGINYTELQATTLKASYPASATVTGLFPGVYNVGFCVYNSGASVLSVNDYANGWIMVTE
ncbi:MAG: hypothetical protein ACKO66_05975, partial [Flavobacteriales bacterium]